MSDYYQTRAAVDSVSVLKTEKLLKILIILAMSVAGAFILWITIAPFTPFRRVDVNSTGEMSREQILEIAGISKKSSFWMTNVQTVADNIMNLSFVKTATIQKHLPSRLEINISTRDPVGAFLVFFENKYMTFFVDASGVVFESSRSYGGMPIISHSGMGTITAGIRLPPSLNRFLVGLETIKTSNPELFALISEIEIRWITTYEDQNYKAYDVTLHLNTTTTDVRVKPDLSVSELKNMVLELDALKRDGITPKVLDKRSNVTAYY
ncbi:MAG: FtsQ-type POTRA domain-containing protein [Treponema sp.]|nr:FtsQ-type POTRA domain-containing protein [Treponema sp.]